MNLDEYTKVVGDYAEQLASAANAADRDSLSAAIAMGELFESKEWVEIGKDLVPIPKNPKSNRSWQPDTIERFHKVTNALLTQAGRPTIKARSTTVRGVGCYRAVKHIPKSSLGTFRTQKQIQPLTMLLTAGYADRIPEAVELAIRDAQERGKPLSGESVDRAARLVKHNAEQGRSGLGQHKIDRLRAKRVKAELAVLEFLDLAAKVKAKDKGNAVEQLAEFRDFLKAELAKRVR